MLKRYAVYIRPGKCRPVTSTAVWSNLWPLPHRSTPTNLAPGGLAEAARIIARSGG